MAKGVQTWENLVQRYARARQTLDEANAAYEAEVSRYDEAYEHRCEAARDAEIAIEDALLDLTPPNLPAVAFQLKVFALRHCGVDIDDAPAPEEGPAGPILRRMHGAMLAAT